jgi:hypothetical protein
MSIGGVYYVNVQQHWSPWMRPWCLLELCITSICSNTDHLELYLDVYWRCVLHQCAATLITWNDILMSIGGVYYVNVQQHWSPWMTSWCLLEGAYYDNVQQHWSPWKIPIKVSFKVISVAAHCRSTHPPVDIQMSFNVISVTAHWRSPHPQVDIKVSFKVISVAAHCRSTHRPVDIKMSFKVINVAAHWRSTHLQ